MRQSTRFSRILVVVLAAAAAVALGASSAPAHARSRTGSQVRLIVGGYDDDEEDLEV